MKIDWLLSLMKALGTKLPQAWPYIVNIAENVKSILSIIGGPAAGNRKFGSPQSDLGNQVVSLAKQHKLPDAEARQIASVFETAEAELAD